MKGYGQFCPVARTAEILTRRWMPLVLRELMAGSTRFSEIKKGLPLISPSLLSERLKELETEGIVERGESSRDRHGRQYRLTEAGRELGTIVELYGHWGRRWAGAELKEEELDASLLMWDIHRRVDTTQISDKPFVAVFELKGAKPSFRYWWLLCREDNSVEICLKDPGYEEKLLVKAELRTLTEIWLGRRKLKEAVAQQMLELSGTPRSVREFPSWFCLSVFAGAS